MFNIQKRVKIDQKSNFGTFWKCHIGDNECHFFQVEQCVSRPEPSGTKIRVGSNVMDVRYKVVALTNDDTICGPFKNNLFFELHLKPFRPF